MTLFGKPVAAALLLSLLGAPAMACLVPEAQLTDVEKECCQAMANDCGRMDMSAEHSCCEKSVQRHDSALVKEISTTVQPDVSLHVAVTPLTSVLLLPDQLSTVLDAAWHAPPVLATSSIEILRI